MRWPNEKVKWKRQNTQWIKLKDYSIKHTYPKRNAKSRNMDVGDLAAKTKKKTSIHDYISHIFCSVFGDKLKFINIYGLCEAIISPIESRWKWKFARLNISPSHFKLSCEHIAEHANDHTLWTLQPPYAIPTSSLNCFYKCSFLI